VGASKLAEASTVVNSCLEYHQVSLGTLHQYNISTPTVTDLITRWLDSFSHSGQGPPHVGARPTCVGNVVTTPSGSQQTTFTWTSSRERTR